MTVLFTKDQQSKIRLPHTVITSGVSKGHWFESLQNQNGHQGIYKTYNLIRQRFYPLFLQ